MNHAALLLISVAISQADPMAKLKPLPLPNDALKVAADDLARQPEFARQYLRYLWVTDGETESAQAVSWALNIISRSSSIERPFPVQVGKLLLLRVDMRAYAPQFDGQAVNDLADWTRTWEELQFDPAFNLLITQDTLKFAAGLVGPDVTTRVRREKWAELPSPPWVHTDGKTYTTKWVQQGYEFADVPLIDAKDVLLARLPGAHVDQPVLLGLAEATYSQAPVVSHQYFLARSLSAIRDKGIYQQLFGGLYYDFVGIRTGVRKGTDLDALLADLGIGDVDRGLDFRKVFDRLRSDQKVAVFRSEVTAGPREVDILPILSGRIDLSTRMAVVTNDLKQQSIDIGRHPLFNLLGIKPDAREVIFTRANSLHGYALFDGNGKRQDEAPPDVAADHTIPAPHHRRLQPAISCISCHEAEGSDGWKPLKNDAKTLLRNVDVFGDLTQTDRSLLDTLDRLKAYAGDPERPLARGRDDYAAGVLRATGPVKGDVKTVVKTAATRLVGEYRRYTLDLVTPSRALAELGIEVAATDAVKVLMRLLPPDPQSRIGPLIPEDPRLAALKAGIPINRSDWALVYGFAAARARQTLASLPRVKEVKK